MIGWAEGCNAEGFGVYLGANPRIRDGGKAEDVALARGVFADLDGATLNEARMRLREAELPPPTMTVLSGGGVRFWWLFDEPMTDLRLWTQIPKGIIAALDADSCIHDWPRIMRMPGFVNTKPERDGARAELVERIADRTHPAEDFPEAELSRPVAGAPRPTPTGNNGRFDQSRLCNATLRYLLNGESLPDGKRHPAGMKALNDLVGCGVPRDHRLVQLLKSQGIASGKPEAELDKMIEYAFSKPRGPSRPEPRAPAKAPPIPPWREFPMDALPEPMRVLVAAVAGATCTDSSFAALAALVVLAGCIGNRLAVTLKSGWSEPSVLRGAMIGRSGIIKSPVYKLITRPLIEEFKCCTPRVHRSDGKVPARIRAVQGADEGMAKGASRRPANRSPRRA